MRGKLFGVGVGPGDPELMTLKAVRTVTECEVVCVPGENYRDSIAYQIARGAVPTLDEKEMICVSMPMVKDHELLKKSHETAASVIIEYLEQSRDVAFLTLGDVSIYSTYLYVHNLVLKAGYETEMICGIPSFCAAAARLGISLAQGSDQLHLIPASYQMEEAISLPGTKVFMKAGRKINEVKEQIAQAGLDAVMVENCGMKEERIYSGIKEIPDQTGYYSLMIVKEGS